MSRKACARVSSSPAKCPCEAKHWGWKAISGVRLGYSDPANVGTLSATSADMREAGATTPILHLFLLIQAPSLHCPRFFLYQWKWTMTHGRHGRACPGHPRL